MHQKTKDNIIRIINLIKKNYGKKYVIDEELLAYLVASASLLTDFQNQSREASILAYNLWRIVCVNEENLKNAKYYRIKSLITKTTFE